MTIRAYINHVPFCRDDLNDALIDLLREEQERQRCNVYTYCLMPDHLHFLVSPRVDGISALTFTDQYKGKATNTSWKFGCQGKLWQPRYFDHIVRSEESLGAISEYILDNPVRKGLVTKREDWKWSGLMNPLPL
ncbi:MAG: transposase [Chloroflexi bacterium]|nr:transposase [Chloroflexota bacterium]